MNARRLFLSFALLALCSPAIAVERLRVEVIESFPHARDAFTQGLVYEEGVLYESTGLYGESTVRRVDLETGMVEKRVDLAAEYFGEGLARVDDRLIQITWREGTAFVYDRETFEEIERFSYEGEGWGLDFDGQRLLMTNGSAEIQYRDAATFELLGSVTARLNGRPLARLNEIEYVKGDLYANVFMTEQLVRIDPLSGEVEAVIDARGLLTAEEREGADVLNGIAYDEDSGTFLITGKKWPRMFRVRFVPVDAKVSDAP